MTPGLVSIIVPVHNRPGLLAEAVASALDQTYRPIEILIVDDGSTDETPDVAAQLAVRNPDLVRVLRQENGGPGAARETGRLAARGEYLQYLDSDDLLLPRKLELQVAALRTRPACGIAYCACRETDEQGATSDLPLRPSDRPLARMFPTFLAQRWWNTLSPLYRRETTDRIGPWSELRLEEDWEYDARIAALGTPLAFVDHVLAEHRNPGGERLSRGSAADPSRLKDRASAHLSILESAAAARIVETVPERVRFARELFLLCRQCGAAGLAKESRQLFDASRRAASRRRRRALDYRVYQFIATAIGWRLAGRASMLWDRLRGPKGG